MDAYFPGTTIKRKGKSAKEFLDGLFFATNGLVLSQVREIVALDTPVIQNWINRGWVQKPVDKRRYTEDHLARIILINMLRDVTRLEVVVNILSYINGNVDSTEDDIISDSELYIYICNILDIVDYDIVFSERELDKVVEKTISNYKEPFVGAKDRLKNGIKIILIYYAAALVKVRADRKCEELGLFIS